MSEKKYDLYIENGPIADESSLLLIKFPAMRSQFENPAEQIHLSLRPKSMKLKLSVDLNPASSSFDPDKALSLASKSVPKIFPNRSVDKNFYSSTKVPEDDNQLYVARVVGDKIVCRPLSHFITMRSEFSHFDVKEETECQEEVRPVSVKFAAPDRQNPNSQPTLQNPQPQFDESNDKEIDLNYYHVSSRKSINQRDALFGKPGPRIKPDPDGPPMEVDQKPLLEPKIESMDVDSVVPGANRGETESQKRSSGNIKELVKDCLKKAKIVSFAEVINYIREKSYPFVLNKSANKEILDALADIAVLVQGNWAIKSEVLYQDHNKQGCTDLTGISLNLFIAARDYLLWQFTQDRIISRPFYTKQVKIPDHDALVLFNQLSIFSRETRRWELKLPTDEEFLREYPDIVQRQATLWKVRKANKLSMFDC